MSIPYARSLVNGLEPASDYTNDEPLIPVGVGPWQGEVHPSDPHYDPQLLADGDRRNVVDRYRYWSREAIVPKR